MTSTQTPDYITVVGHGRSGTNMVLDMLDCHPGTFCRNEPNELVGTSFAGLGEAMFLSPEPADFNTRWARAVTRAATASGHRDRPLTDKTYLRTHPAAAAAQYMMQRPKFRRLFMPKQDGRPVEEWTAPGLYVDRGKLTRALPVFKVLLSPAWTIKAHDAFPGQRVVHVLRQPQDFIQSWWSRYVQKTAGSPEQVFADNLPSVARILDHFDRPDGTMGAYSLSNLVTSELWRWRYVNEVLVQKLGTSPRYLQVGYEAAMGDQPAWAQKVYDFAGLEMTEHSRQAVANMRNTLFKARKDDGLDPVLVEDALDHVLSGSVLRDAVALDKTPSPAVSPLQ